MTDDADYEAVLRIQIKCEVDRARLVALTNAALILRAELEAPRDWEFMHPESQEGAAATVEAFTEIIKELEERAGRLVMKLPVK